MPESLALLVFAAALSFAAGFALHRGGICAVRAVRDVVEEGRWARFASFMECAAWALALLLAAEAAGASVRGQWPGQQALPLAVLGGMLFGAGALLNGACAFGSAGRLAAGDISFLLLIPGFVLGALAATQLGFAVSLSNLPPWRPTGAGGIALAATLAMFVLWRLWSGLGGLARAKPLGRHLAQKKWPPALAMAIVAISNVGLMLIVASWPYTTLLLDLVVGRGGEVVLRVPLVLLFLAGAFTGALSGGRFRWRGASPAILVARFGGGLAMGFGAALIPGGNDTLILIGLPLLQPTAIAAYAAMIVVIALGFGVQRLARRKLAVPGQAP